MAIVFFCPNGKVTIKKHDEEMEFLEALNSRDTMFPFHVGHTTYLVGSVTRYIIRMHRGPYSRRAEHKF